jgi:hypothetical protein
LTTLPYKNNDNDVYPTPASLRRVSILAIDKVFASTLMQAKDFFHLASLRYSKQLGLGLQPMFEIAW